MLGSGGDKRVNYVIELFPGTCDLGKAAQRALPLAPSPRPSHNSSMDQDHPYTIKVEPHGFRPGRFRWSVREDGRECDRSSDSYATRGEAEAEADKVMQKLIAKWREPK
jgi:hypothetical protein